MKKSLRLAGFAVLLTFFPGSLVAQPTAEFAWRALYGPHAGTVPYIMQTPEGTLFAGTEVNQHGVFRSMDGGLTWQQTSTGIYLESRSVDALVLADSGHVLIGTNSHIGTKLYRSTDGGNTWTEQPGDCGPYAFARMPDGELLALCGYGQLVLSMDNGRTWTDFAKPLNHGDDVVVNDSGHVFVGGWGFKRSKDGGVTWDALGVVKDVRSLAIDSEGRIYAGNYNENIAASGVYRSEDNGDTWTPLKNGIRITGNRNIAFTAEGHILVGAYGTGIWKSTDDGATWVQSNDGLGHLIIRHLHVTPDGTVLAGTDGGGVYRSTDGGETWNQVGLPVASVLKLLISPVTGSIFASSATGISRSSDDGQTWKPINAGLRSLDVRAMAMAPDGTVYAGLVNGSPNLYRSDDDGDSWTAASEGIGTNAITGLGVAADGTVYVANYPTLYESTDRGETWTEAGDGSGVRWIDFSAAGDMFVASWGQGLRRLLQGSDTWEALDVGYPYVSPLYVGPSGNVYAIRQRSEDNGDTWTAMGGKGTVADYKENSLGQLFAATTNYGDGVHRSTNFGDTWEKVNTGIPTNDIRALAIDDEQYLYAAPFGHSVYRTVLPSTVSTAVEDRSTPDGFTLDQNYPNPFNPTTTIRFGLPVAADVSLRLYDVLGRQVAELVRGTLPAGRHEVSFDASGLPSGAYLYRLETGSFRDSRTMVLLR